ncbi:MAG: hypothetical protein JWO42_4140 [Chloroflexi bacterium]|nr:hypothetical protein [Chloroflexota bacterium]
MQQQALDLSAIPVIDNHCHAYINYEQPLDARQYRRLFSEANSAAFTYEHVPQASYYRWALKELGRILDCAATEDAVLAKRASFSLPEFTALLLGEAQIEAMLIDTGLGGPEFLSLDAMRSLTGCRIEWVLRLEVLAQHLIAETHDFATFQARYLEELRDLPGRGIVSLKSIAAYRTGLDIQPVTDDQAATAFAEVCEDLTLGQRPRLVHKVLIDYIVHLGMAQAAAQGGIPIQFHTGYGDPDTDLRLGNPLHLRPLFEDSALENVPIVMLHESYPFTREAAFLATVYPNAYLDISYSVPFLDYHELLACTHQALGVAPWSKVLYSSDGFSIPEHGWLGAIHGRRVLADALRSMIEVGVLDHDEALTAATAILNENSRRVYRLR